MLKVYQKLIEASHQEFSDIVEQALLLRPGSTGTSKLRIRLKEGSYVDIWISMTGRYSYHWGRRTKAGEIFRHDNAPDFPNLGTFPKHFHDGTEQNVKESFLSDVPEEALKQFLSFVRGKHQPKST